MESEKLPYLWDYDLNLQEFRQILEGEKVLGRLDQDWAACRLIEYASCAGTLGPRLGGLSFN